jgi:hypothetical protein
MLKQNPVMEISFAQRLKLPLRSETAAETCHAAS